MAQRVERWIEVSPSQFTHEAEGLSIIRKLLPNNAPFRAWSNLRFRDGQGKWHEVDLVVLGRRRLHLVELKYYSGALRGDDLTWQWDGHRAESPLKLAQRMAQRLARKLQDELIRWMQETGHAVPDVRTAVPFVQASVFLHNPGIRCLLPPASRTDLFGLDGSENQTGLPGISERLLEPATPQQYVPARHDETIAAIVQRIEIVQRRQREARSWDGDIEFDDLIEDSEAIQPGEAPSFALLQEQLRSVLDTLSEREAGVVSMRFGLADGQPKTLYEIGKVYGVTRERIRQIESKTMSRLRSPSRSLVGRAYLDRGQFSISGGGHAGGGGSGGEPPYSGGGERQRYLRGRYPESISVGEPFGLLASVVLVGGPSSAMLKPFNVPREGRDVRLEAYAPPGLRLLGHRLLTVHVPTDDDSEPVMFELRADEPGVRTVSVTAWIDGSYLGELRVDITAEHGHPVGAYRDVLAEITTEPTEGAVSLVVRFDSRQNAYRFEFRDEDNPDEVTSNLAYEPGPRVEQLIASLEALARGRSGHDVGQARTHLVNSGAALWHELVPKGLRDQFWERQDRIRQLTILADKDTVPWELLYPMDPGCDKGFLVEQFPVTRAIFGRRPARKLSLWPARFVLPEGSLPEARAEIDAMRVLLDPSQPVDEVISKPTPLQNLISSGEFGLLHFACHNTYDPGGGSSIRLGKVPFTPTDIATAAINRVLARSAPTVFINACRSAGLNATYNRLDGWATKFLEAGAAAFIGSLWAVSDGAAREFAQELYGQLRAGSLLGQAVKCARAAAASQPDDPTWLAYTVYGDPRATLAQNRP